MMSQDRLFFFFFNHLDCLAKEMRQDPKLATYFGTLKWWQKAVTLHGTDVTSFSMLQDGRWKHWCQRLNYIFVWEENCTFPCLFFSVQLKDFNMPSSIFTTLLCKKVFLKNPIQWCLSGLCVLYTERLIELTSKFCLNHCPKVRILKEYVLIPAERPSGIRSRHRQAQAPTRVGNLFGIHVSEENMKQSASNHQIFFW